MITKRLSNLSFALSALFSITLACGPHGGGGSADGDDDGPCSDGDTRCDGKSYQTCVGDHWEITEACGVDRGCSPDMGCTTCDPGGLACLGDSVVACSDSGEPTTDVVEDCGDMACAHGECVPPCSPEALDKTYSGCEFYAADLPQWGKSDFLHTPASSQQFGVVVANPADVSIDVVVEQNDADWGQPPMLQQVVSVQVAARSAQAIPLPQREVSGWVENSMPNRSRLSAAAYRITTSRPATVYQFSPQYNANVYSDDASLLIPVNALDENYVVLGWPGRGGEIFLGDAPDNRSFVTIIGTEPNTQVRVVPTTGVMPGDSVPGMQPGEAFVATLGPFEVLNIEGGDFKDYGLTDFTGTRIEATAPIVVFSGAECTLINPPVVIDDGDGCCCDHLEEQLYPRSALGSKYAVTRTEPRSTWPIDPEPEYFRILADADDTIVSTSLPSPDDAFTLNRGEYREILTADDFTVDSSHPVIVGEFLLSRDNTNTYSGDPDFILVPPIAQYRNFYVFYVPSGYFHNNIMISIPSDAEATLDGAPMPGDCTRVPNGSVGGTAYDALRCPITEGSHILDASASVGLVVAGHGKGPVGYGYTGGMDFQPINEDCSDDSQCPGGEFCSGGKCVPQIE